MFPMACHCCQWCRGTQSVQLEPSWLASVGGRSRAWAEGRSGPSSLAALSPWAGSGARRRAPRWPCGECCGGAGRDVGAGRERPAVLGALGSLSRRPALVLPVAALSSL